MDVVNQQQAQARYFNFRLGFGIPIGIMLMMLFADPTRLDFFLTRQFYSPETGFVGHHSYWLENILHERAKQVLIALALLAVIGFGTSLFVEGFAKWRRPLGYIVLTLGLCTGLVSPLKEATAIHCPWSLSDFGGMETYSTLLGPRATTDSPGKCWPGGHASAGFSLLCLFFALRDKRPRAARYALALALGLGSLFSLGRMMQGAHFLSHNLWTLLIDWVVCLATYRWIIYRPQGTRRNIEPAVPA